LDDNLQEHDSSIVLSSEISDTSPESNMHPDSWVLPTSLPENTESSSSATVMPIIRSVDKPSSSLPQHITMTEDFLCAGLGFCRIDAIKSKFADLYKDTVTFDSLPADAFLDHGDFASIRKNHAILPRYHVHHVLARLFIWILYSVLRLRWETSIMAYFLWIATVG